MYRVRRQPCRSRTVRRIDPEYSCACSTRISSHVHCRTLCCRTAGRWKYTECRFPLYLKDDMCDTEAWTRNLTNSQDVYISTSNHSSSPSTPFSSLPTNPHTPSTPPIRRIPKRPQQHRHMIMLALRLLPNQKLDLYLREKRLNPPLPKVALGIKCQTVLLVSLLHEDFFETRGGEGRGRCPGGYAAVGICEAGEFGRVGGGIG